MVFLAASLSSQAATTITDDFSSYGSTLTTGDSTNPAVYSWAITNHVNSTTTIPITPDGAELAGRFPGHTHPRNWTAEADINITPQAQPTVSTTNLTFSIVERHEFTELDILVAGNPTPEKFIFSGTGQVELVFTQTGINEYLNGALQASRTYASVGWSPSDKVSSIKFIGLHHNNGSINRSYIDNISLVAIPEPGTTTIASLALLGLSLRRRRAKHA